MMEESLNEHLDKSQADFTPIMDASRAFENSPQNNPFVFSPFTTKPGPTSPSLSFSPTARIIDINLKNRKENTGSILTQEEETTVVTGKIISLSSSGNRKAGGYSTLSAENIDLAQKSLSIKPALLDKAILQTEADKKSTNLTAVKIPGKRKNVFGFIFIYRLLSPIEDYLKIRMPNPRMLICRWPRIISM